ncbi:MAG: tetratricopeptide repeat protein [Candidatus Eremiobacteraeota bacterium]|nr:tetratricopeptide repeat protein [Candidatus Eremiobacteraeota bacterium]MCW5867566.1 tetratricopeptide repeat protein [Candidatus Eremiobacteraeota bacterium]
MFGFLKGPVKESDKTRDQLFALVERDLQVELGELCRQKKDEIIQEFAVWQAVSPKPKMAQKYAAGLLGVAQKMAELGEDRPLDMLNDGKPSSWRSGLRQATELMKELRFAEAVKILEPFLVTGYQGAQEGADQYQGTTLGKLGECEFQLGHFEKGEAHLRRAVALCQSQRDWEGVYANLGHLYELERYRGQPDVAQGHALTLGKALSAQGKDPSQANANARACQAPPVRAVASLGGVQMEVDQLPSDADPGQVSFFLARNRPTLALAAAFTAQGRQAAEQGNYAAALESFSKAAQLDAYEPDCRHLAGHCLLHLKRYAEANASYKQLERLAPGWSQVRHDSWLAQELAAGRIGHDLWLLELELLGTAPPRLERVLEGLGQYPKHAALHFAHGHALLASGREAEANQAYQQALALAENEDLKSRILLAASQVVPKAEVRKQILGHLLSLKLPNLVAAATARYLLRHL